MNDDVNNGGNGEDDNFDERDKGNWLGSYVPSPYAYEKADKNGSDSSADDGSDFFAGIEPSPYAEEAPVVLREPNWVMDAKGRVPLNHHNIKEIFQTDKDWQGVLAYDEFARRKMLLKRIPGTTGSFEQRELQDGDYIDIVDWFNCNGYPTANKNIIVDCTDRECTRNIISPVRHYLEGLGENLAKKGPQARQPEVLDMFLETYLGVIPKSPEQAVYIRAVSRKWLISAVARAVKPGCKVDTAIILEGSQGAGKSTALRFLAGDDWFGDALPPMHTKDAADYLKGQWIVEMAELANMGKAEVEVTKSFMSRAVEEFRPAYGREIVKMPRACILAGTTNRSDYLRDETGNRRFWPILCGKIDTNGIKRDRDYIWAEAYLAFKDGEKWHLTGAAAKQAEIEQGSRLSADEWIGDISEFLIGKTETTVGEICEEVFSMLPRDIHRGVTNRISPILGTLGWSKTGKARKGRALWSKE